MTSSGNEKFYQDVVAAEAADQARHSALFASHADAYNRYYDLSSVSEERYVRENHPELAKAVDEIYVSLANLQKQRSESTARRDGLIKSLVSEIAVIAARKHETDEPMARLRSDLRELSEFRATKLDGVTTDFWLLNVTNHVARDRKSISGHILKQWCKTVGIKPAVLNDGIMCIAPLFDQHPYNPVETMEKVANSLEEQPFDADAFLHQASTWEERNDTILKGVVAHREAKRTVSPAF
jgi:hypothetical protein